MGYPIRRKIAAWVAVAALLFQVFLPYGLAAAPGAGRPEALLGADHHHADHHHHDPGLANSHGRDGTSRHSHTGGSSCRPRIDIANAPPFTVIDAPALPAVALRWAAFVPDWIAPAPSGADGFSRPLPRAPPLTA